MNKRGLVTLIGALLIFVVAFAGPAAANSGDVQVNYSISPDTLTLSGKGKYISVEIFNTDPHNYSVSDLNPQSVELMICLPSECNIGGRCQFIGLGELGLVKSPEINEGQSDNVEDDKLVLMYNRTEFYEKEFSYVCNGESTETNVKAYLEDACDVDTNIGAVKFKIQGNFYNNNVFKGNAFSVDVRISGGEGSDGGGHDEGGSGGNGGSGGEGGCDGDHDDGGCDCDHDNDVPEAIPEFPSIVIPLVATIGMMFAFQRRK
ncbi:PEF-CTERM sorting domain-containing protein [Methanolobus sp. WCC4]|uniref:PEF-CTERM sorting domain-containing protein n=1 Tax=Methanolobus sp. WCC4 TaxID=3125784 RepID=UPI0030F7F236